MTLAFKKRGDNPIDKILGFFFGKYIHVELIIFGNKSFSVRPETGASIEYLEYNNLDWDYICIGYANHIDRVEELIGQCTKSFSVVKEVLSKTPLTIPHNKTMTYASESIVHILSTALPHIPTLSNMSSPNSLYKLFTSLKFRPCLFGDIYNT